MIRTPTRSTRTATLVPYTTLVLLDIAALAAALVDDVVDVAAAPRGRERVVHVAIVDAIGGQPLRIDVDLERRDIGQVGQAHRGQIGVVVRHREQPVARGDE